MLGQRRSPLLGQWRSNKTTPAQCLMVLKGPPMLIHPEGEVTNYTHSDVKTKQILCHANVYSTHWTVNQCRFNVDPTFLTMAQQQHNFCELSPGGSAVYFAAALRVTLSSPHRQKGHYPNNLIHWPNADVMLDHCMRR